MKQGRSGVVVGVIDMRVKTVQSAADERSRADRMETAASAGVAPHKRLQSTSMMVMIPEEAAISYSHPQTYIPVAVFK